MDDDSSPRPSSSGTGRRRRLTKKTSSPRPRPLLLTSESSEDSNPGPIAGPSTESAKCVVERRCKSQSPRKKSRMKGGSRERSKERGRSGTRRRSATGEDTEAARQRPSRNQVAHELKDMLTEGLSEQLQDSYLQLSVSESTGSSRLEHQQSTTSHGSSTMGYEDTLEEGLAAQLRSFSPPRIRHPVYDECREGHRRLYLQVPADEESRDASGQPHEDDEEQWSSEQHSGAVYGQMYIGEHRGQYMQGSGEEVVGYASGQPTEVESEMRFSSGQHPGPLYGNIYVGSGTSEEKLAVSSEGMAIASDSTYEDSLAAQLHALSPQRINRDFGTSEEGSPTGQWHHSRKSTGGYRDDDDDNQQMEFQ
ncbi:uncharacterized protein [Macrobrachium rosenbergii]|uniref:uncharacterized protein isoform X2 n=1 Tax=Macrobrachium rosenbergii TaxID=79674 RepID=UPI0034D7582B